MQRSQTETIGLVLNGEALVVRFFPNSLGSPCSTNIDYVRYQVDWVQSCLGKESNQKYLGVMFILDGWDDRQTDEDNRRADAYCHRLYSSSPYDD